MRPYLIQLSCFGLFLWALTPIAQAIGLQHGIFRSQSTQGATWLGEVEIAREHYDITVHRNFLDVTLEMEFRAAGTPPEEFRNALEIVGNMNFEMNSKVTSMLVWYKGKILKAKLKPKGLAREQYEEVVDRNAEVPPPPRDPVLLEWIQQDNYDISIFPVVWGESRKLRIRYVIPSADGNATMGYPHAFGENATAVVRADAATPAFEIHFGNGEPPLQSSSEVALDHREYALTAYSWGGSPVPTVIRALDAEPLESSVLHLGKISGFHFEGWAGFARYRIPAEVREGWNSSQAADKKIFAVLNNGRDECRKEIGVSEGLSGNEETLRILSDRSLGLALRWELSENGEATRTWEESFEVVAEHSASNFVRSFAGVPFYAMAETMPQSLGPALGFIDEKYALVALEEDALPSYLQARYEERGVPNLRPEEIQADLDDMEMVGLEAWLAGRPGNQDDLLQTTSLSPGKNGLPSGFTWEWSAGALRIRIPASALVPGQSAKLELFDAAGRNLESWDLSRLSRPEIQWRPAARLRGSLILMRLNLGSKTFVGKIQVH